MANKKIYYNRATAPLGYMKFLRIMLILGAVASAFWAFTQFDQGEGIPFLISAVQAVANVVIVIGLFKFKWYGPVVLIALWTALCGVNVWDIIEDGYVLGNEIEENVISIVVRLIFILITAIYFKRRRPLFQPYSGEIPAEEAVAAAAAAQPLRQAQPYPAQQAQPVRAPQQPQTPQASAHVTKLQQAYSHFNASTVSKLFPGGISQADNAVISLANLLGVNLSSSGSDTYFKLLKAYADTAIAKEVKKQPLDQVISSVKEANKDILASDADVQLVESFFELNYNNGAFTVVDMASLAEVKSQMLNTFGLSSADAISQQPYYQPMTQMPSAAQQAAGAAAAAAAFAVPAPETAPQQPVVTAPEPVQAPGPILWTEPLRPLDAEPAPADPGLAGSGMQAPQLEAPEIPMPVTGQAAPELKEPVLSEPAAPAFPEAASVPELKEPELAEPVLAESPRFCPNCGAPQKTGDRFCPNCGRML